MLRIIGDNVECTSDQRRMRRRISVHRRVHVPELERLREAGTFRQRGKHTREAFGKRREIRLLHAGSQQNLPVVHFALHQPVIAQLHARAEAVFKERKIVLRRNRNELHVEKLLVHLRNFTPV